METETSKRPHIHFALSDTNVTSEDEPKKELNLWGYYNISYLVTYALFFFFF